MIDLLNSYGIYSLFAVLLGVFLIVDLMLFQRKSVAPTYRSSLLQTGAWLLVALSFGVVLYFDKGKETGLQFTSAYLMEWSLSADNIFVFLLILQYFQIPAQYHAKVLFWGIIGAIVFRGVFIFAGSSLVHHFGFILYLFGALLIYTGFKLWKESMQEEEEKSYSPDKNPIYKFLTKRFSFSSDVSRGNYWWKENGKRIYSPLFLVICIIATTDVLFAIDSIPAVFAISRSKLVIYSSNVFAVMGLRALFFTLSHIIKRFSYLQQGISFILIFIGAKMLLEYFDLQLSAAISLLIIVLVLSGSILFSLWMERKEENKKIDA